MIPFEIETEIENALESFRVPGCQVITYKEGLQAAKVTEGYIKAFGHQDLNRQIAMTAKTRLPLASCTKLFTLHLLIPILEEHGHTMFTPLNVVLPGLEAELGEKGRWTCRDVCTHMTGLQSWDKWFEIGEDGLSSSDIVDKVLPPL
ncbi:uncharacterized protein I303_107030 [Kwoniella dejecticola CBS 10117]|uniref:Beta-lactamase-related domain-containing protein n=1 Tax=Kwoniella dejecticola CBS 10117 TaxID=1296121 RepID=A0A1A5ZYJ3_9TREE|nr:uncharacterized protein I303_06431 [Kwoniella dejecticola CBS 10117]OBR82874.1 hypothetical protein I303_06431 [Kwoniella dejecticola CBS 10117]